MISATSTATSGSTAISGTTGSGSDDTSGMGSVVGISYISGTSSSTEGSTSIIMSLIRSSINSGKSPPMIEGSSIIGSSSQLHSEVQHCMAAPQHYCSLMASVRVVKAPAMVMIVLNIFLVRVSSVCSKNITFIFYYFKLSRPLYKRLVPHKLFSTSPA